MRTIYNGIGILLSSCLLLTGSAWAQNTDSEDDAYRTVTSFGVTTNTNSGILGGFSFRQSKLLAGTLLGMPQYRYLSVEVVNVKHPKELQSANSYAGSRFIDGKENYLLVVRPQYGREVRLFQRSTDEASPSTEFWPPARRWGLLSRITSRCRTAINCGRCPPRMSTD